VYGEKTRPGQALQAFMEPFLICNLAQVTVEKEVQHRWLMCPAGTFFRLWAEAWFG